MSRRSWQAAALLAAIVTMGLTAGFFFAWDVSVMPGLVRLDDRAFVGVFQVLDRAIMTSPLFMTAFIGALAFTGVATVLYLRADDRAPLPWIALAFGLYLATVVITMAVHEPLNQVLRTAGDPVQIADPAAVRETFQETRWSSWNIVRTVATTAAFGCLARALVLHGRVTGDPTGRRSRPTSAVPRPPSGTTP